MRQIAISGKLAPFGFMYKEAQGDKKSFCTFFVSLNMGVKDEATGYWVEKPIKCICNNGVADRFNNYFDVTKRDYIVLAGELQMGNEWTNSEGDIVAGQWEVRVTNIDNFGSKGANNTGSNTASTTQQPPAKTPPAKQPPKKLPPKK